MINNNRLTTAIISLATFITIFIILFGFESQEIYQLLGLLGCLQAVIATTNFANLKEKSRK